MRTTSFPHRAQTKSGDTACTRAISRCQAATSRCSAIRDRWRQKLCASSKSTAHRLASGLRRLLGRLGAIPLRHVVIHLTLPDVVRCLVVDLPVVERIGENLYCPDESRLDSQEEEQVQRAKYHRADADDQPKNREVVEEAAPNLVSIEEAEERLIEVQYDGRSSPDGQEHDLAAQVVTDLHTLLVLVGCVVHFIVGLRFEEEVTDLAYDHRERPSRHHRGDRVDEYQHIAREEARGADEMKQLVDSVVVVIAVVVPALLVKFFKKRHVISPFHAWNA